LPGCKAIYQTGAATLKSRNRVLPVQMKSGRKCRSQCCPPPFSCWLRSSVGGAAVSRPRPESRGRCFNISAAMRFALRLCFSNNVCSQTPGGPKTRDTDSWLHDTDSHKKFGPDLLLKVLMINIICTKFGHLILRKKY